MEAKLTSICGGTPMRYRSCSQSLARTASSTSTMKPTWNGCPQPTITSARRSESAPESQPSLLPGMRASSTPVIVPTADLSACATAACDTITPRNGSLIVLLQVLLQLAPLRHPLDQSLVEALRRIDAAVTLQVVHRHHLADHREVLPRVQRDGHERQGDVQDLGRLAIEPGAVVLTRRVPVVQLHHHLDALLLAHRAHAEQRTDVDQPHAANLHVVPRQLETLGRRLLSLRDHDAGQVETKKRLEGFPALGRGE